MNQYDKKKLLNYIDAVSFALIDTTLYLDTHPNDQKAIDHFNQYQKARKQALKEYARNFEPLTTVLILTIALHGQQIPGHG